MQIPAIGVEVEIVTPVIRGTVTDIRSNVDRKIECCINFVGADGEQHQRWFNSELLSEVSE